MWVETGQGWWSSRCFFVYRNFVSCFSAYGSRWCHSFDLYVGFLQDLTNAWGFILFYFDFVYFTPLLFAWCNCFFSLYRRICFFSTIPTNIVPLAEEYEKQSIYLRTHLSLMIRNASDIKWAVSFYIDEVKVINAILLSRSKQTFLTLLSRKKLASKTVSSGVLTKV